MTESSESPRAEEVASDLTDGRALDWEAVRKNGPELGPMLEMAEQMGSSPAS